MEVSCLMLVTVASSVKQTVIITGNMSVQNFDFALNLSQCQSGEILPPNFVGGGRGPRRFWWRSEII